MKVIGRVEPEHKGDEGQILNAEYMGGAIVMLKPREAKELALLQEVWNGKIFCFNTQYYDIQEDDMEDAFKAIRAFVEAKLAVNEFRATADSLDSMLIKGRKDEL